MTSTANNLPHGLKYTPTHEWVKLEGDNIVTVGITDHAQSLLGDMVYVELPETETTQHAEQECCVVESVKAASDVYAPVSGDITEVNEALVDNPALVNSEPYEGGWLFRMQVENISDLEGLLDSEAYQAQIASETA